MASRIYTPAESRSDPGPERDQEQAERARAQELRRPIRDPDDQIRAQPEGEQRASHPGNQALDLKRGADDGIH